MKVSTNSVKWVIYAEGRVRRPSPVVSVQPWDFSLVFSLKPHVIKHTLFFFCHSPNRIMPVVRWSPVNVSCLYLMQILFAYQSTSCMLDSAAVLAAGNLYIGIRSMFDQLTWTFSRWNSHDSMLCHIRGTMHFYTILNLSSTVEHLKSSLKLIGPFFFFSPVSPWVNTSLPQVAPCRATRLPLSEQFISSLLCFKSISTTSDSFIFCLNTVLYRPHTVSFFSIATTNFT